MKSLFIITLVLMSLVSFPSWGLTMDDLVQREGLHYQKFTDVPFTGEIDEGLVMGNFRNGKKDGLWGEYYKNGQLRTKGEYQNGKRSGHWVFRHETGVLWSEGRFKEGLREGLWKNFTEDGRLWREGGYKNGKQEGYWIYYTKTGKPYLPKTGIYKNGLKVSD